MGTPSPEKVSGVSGGETQKGIRTILSPTIFPPRQIINQTNIFSLHENLTMVSHYYINK